MDKDQRKKLNAATHVPSSDPSRYYCIHQKVSLQLSPEFSRSFMGVPMILRHWRVMGFLKLRVVSLCNTQRSKEHRPTVFRRLWQNILTSVTSSKIFLWKRNGSLLTRWWYSAHSIPTAFWTVKTPLTWGGKKLVFNELPLARWYSSSWRMKDQLDVTCYFISFLMCSTCFGHSYIHHQELATVLLNYHIGCLVP